MTKRNQLIITVDGPSASGKTSTARLLAGKLGVFHLVGGVFFRSLTYYCILNNVFNEEMVSKTSESINIKLTKELGNEYLILLNNVNVTKFLWTEEVDSLITDIAKYPRVRSARKKWLRNFSKTYDLVADGRSLGSEIFPNATFKFYLTCDLEERASRRLAQSATNSSLNHILECIALRDKKDSEGPINRLLPPLGAIKIDSTNLEQFEVVNIMYDYICHNK